MWLRAPAVVRLGTVGLLASLAACAIIGTTERPAPGGLYREALVGQPLSLNPLLDPQDPVTQAVSRLAFSGLVRVLDGGQIQPDLAERWTTEPDGRAYVFNLRPNARWHDDQPVTAADVVATIRIVQAETYPGPEAIKAVWRRVRAEAIDERTVRLQLDQPYASFIEACSLPLLPRHVYGDGGLDLRELAASYQPVGGGPFRVAEVTSEAVRLVRHEGYVGRRPYLEAVELRLYPDLSAALAALAAGQVDGLASSPTPALAARAQDLSLSVQTLPLFGQQDILLVDHRSFILGDRSVRQAMALGIDRSALFSGPLAQAALPASGPIPSASWAYSPVVDRPADPAAARAVLDTAGWVGASIRSQAGRPLRLQLAVPTDSRLLAMAEGIEAQLEPLGFQIDLQPMDLLDLYRERLGPRRYDLALVDLGLGSADPDPYPFWHSSGARAGLNLAAYEREDVDHLLTAARLDGDPARRRAALEAFQRIWAEDVPSIVLGHPLMSFAIASRFRGVRLGTVYDPADRFQHVAEWHLNTERRPAWFQ